MSWRNFAAYAATSVFAFAAVDASAALPAPCWHTGELPSVRLHDFKTMLLVGALKCRDRAPGSLEGYNQFVNQKRELIISSNHVVKARFIRDGGMAAGANDFTDYETGLANRYSAMAHDDAFCGQVGTYARLAANASDEDIGVLANAVARTPSTAPCGPETGPVGKPTAVAAIQPAVMTEPLPVEEGEAAPGEAVAADAAAADAAATDDAAADAAPAYAAAADAAPAYAAAADTAPAYAAAADTAPAEAEPFAASASPDAEVPAEAPPAVAPEVANSEQKAVSPPAPSASQALAEAAKALAAAAVALDAQNANPATASKPD